MISRFYIYFSFSFNPILTKCQTRFYQSVEMTEMQSLRLSRYVAVFLFGKYFENIFRTGFTAEAL